MSTNVEKFLAREDEVRHILCTCLAPFPLPPSPRPCLCPATAPPPPLTMSTFAHRPDPQPAPDHDDVGRCAQLRLARKFCDDQAVLGAKVRASSS